MKKNRMFFKKDEHNFKTILWFGMYKDYTIQDVWEINSQYLRWVLDNTEMLSLKKSDEDKIYKKALQEDEQMSKCITDRRLRRFFGGANHINGSDRYDTNRYDWDPWNWEDPH